MQVAAAAPRYVKREEVPSAEIEKERQLCLAEVKEQGKPEAMAAKIVEGKLNKWFQEVCLLEQPWIRENKQTIEELRAALVSKTGENVQIRRFIRFQLGEGIEKRAENFAEEIAKMNSAVTQS